MSRRRYRRYLGGYQCRPVHCWTTVLWMAILSHALIMIRGFSCRETVPFMAMKLYTASTASFCIQSIVCSSKPRSLCAAPRASPPSDLLHTLHFVPANSSSSDCLAPWRNKCDCGIDLKQGHQQHNTRENSHSLGQRVLRRKLHSSSGPGRQGPRPRVSAPPHSGPSRRCLTCNPVAKPTIHLEWARMRCVRCVWFLSGTAFATLGNVQLFGTRDT